MAQQYPWVTGVGGEAQLPASFYQSFSGGLLEMGALMRRSGPEAFLHETLLVLKRFIGFDAAWWGEVHPGAAGVAPRNVLHASIGLRASFAEEWNRLVAADDGFARASMSGLGTVFRASGDGGEAGEAGDVAPEMVDFVERHGLNTVMATTLELPGSGLLFFVCLYRHCPRSAFSDVESLLFEEFTQHMLQAWQYRLADLQATASAASLDGMAIADLDGRLHYVGARVGEVLARQGGDWQGTVLPPLLTAALERLPCSLVAGGAKLVLERNGGLVAIVLADGGDRRALMSPRELSAALLYARGQSYKEIARVMGLSPSTVRTYLRNAYGSLGVSNKIELATALAHR
ncbi:response regulator transcription factor [Duganella sp. PWIR1]